MIGEFRDVSKRMKFQTAWVLTGMAGMVLAVPAMPEAVPASAVRPANGDIDELVRDLSNESYRVREKATEKIWSLGDKALAALEVAAESRDPELRLRARDLLRKIQLFITPETDPSVIVLVERYATASPNEKLSLLAQMGEKRAWRQILKLYAAERDGDVRQKLQPAVNGIALNAARGRLLQGDADGAREFLELAPADSEGLLALAEFHRTHGTLEAELARAKSITGEKSAAWQLALHRAAGNITAARDAATSAGDAATAAAMAVLAGDPLPWLEESVSDNGGDDLLGAGYVKVVRKRWLGEKIRPADLKPIVDQLSSRDRLERGTAINMLFLLGELELAEPAFAKDDPLSAFIYFEALERIPEALEALGLDPKRPDYRSWVEKRLKKISVLEIEDERGVKTETEELVSLAGFLERRGLESSAKDAFAEPLAALAARDENTFVDFLGQLFGNRLASSGAPRLAADIGVTWAGDDEDRWGEVLVAAFGDDDTHLDWWDWLAELDPKAGRVERLDGMLALFGLGNDPDHLRTKWLDLAWQAIGKAAGRQRDVMVERISTLMIAAGDVSNSLRAWELLPPDARDNVFWGQHIMLLSAAGRWGDAADVILKQISIASEGADVVSPEVHAYAAAALRRADRPEEAQAHDQWAEKLALGNAGACLRIGSGYAYGGDYERAAAWWARAAWESEPDSAEFTTAVTQLSEIQMEEGRWAEVAAAAELMARIYTSSNFRGSNPLPFWHQRLQADLARALSILETDRPRALAMLAECYQNAATDGTLADFFFPALRKVGLTKQHDEWFMETWNRFEKIIRQYPESDTSRNTAAWFASRAGLQLDDAEKHLAEALASSPGQPAYLDTMAEINFARGNRAKALEWSDQAVNSAPNDAQLRRQQERFRSAPLPGR